MTNAESPNSRDARSSAATLRDGLVVALRTQAERLVNGEFVTGLERINLLYEAADFIENGGSSSSLTPGAGDATQGAKNAEPGTASDSPPPITDEQARILRAVSEGRMVVNGAGRYVIDGEPRPDRKSREQLRGRGLIDHFYEQGRGTHWRVTAKGKAVLDALSA